jgi:hypothetical protein
LASINPGHVLFEKQAISQLKDAEPEKGVHEQWQDDDHQNRAPIAELVAHFSEPDDPNDGPAHP